MTALCTQLLQQSGGRGGLYLPTAQQPLYAARFDQGHVSDNLAANGTSALVYGGPSVTQGGNGALPSLNVSGQNGAMRYVDTTVLDRSSLTILMAAKFDVYNPGVDWSKVSVLCSNFANNETGTLQFIQQSGAISLGVSSASSGLSNTFAVAPITAAQATNWGLYCARIQTVSSSTTLDVSCLTAGSHASQSGPARFISPNVRSLLIGATPALIFGSPLSVCDPIILPYAASDADITALAQIYRIRAAPFGVAV